MTGSKADLHVYANCDCTNLSNQSVRCRWFADLHHALALFIIFPTGNNWCNMVKLESLIHNTSDRSGPSATTALTLEKSHLCSQFLN